MKRSKEVKAAADRANMLATAIYIMMHPEPPPVQGATLSALTATWLMSIHKDDRLAALQNLHQTVVNIAVDMEKQVEKAAASKA